MFFKRFYDDKLAQASYLVGCQATDEAIVVDPNRDAEQYVRAAQREGLRITHVTETHIHADFASGSRELARLTGARLYLSDEGGPDWKYAFAAGDGAVLLKDGDSIAVGNVRLTVMHTPGHTPEHIVFMVTDTPASSEPVGMLSGDFLFVGDVGRPDLLEKAARVAGTMEQAARSLFHSLSRTATLPDHLQIWPGHGAGSACGRALGALPQSTLGYERISNWALRMTDEDEFVREVLAGQPEPPRYFAEMKRMNRDGPRILGTRIAPAVLGLAALRQLMQNGSYVVDLRHRDAFGKGHLPGTINIPLNRSFTNWAGWIIPYDRDFAIISESDSGEAVSEAIRDLAMIGLDRVAGVATTAVFDELTSTGAQLQQIPQRSVAEVRQLLESGEAHAVDVRWEDEWRAGHIPGVGNIPLGFLPDRVADAPVGKPLVVFCRTNTRSPIAASLLQAGGRSDVLLMPGGFSAWRSAGMPVEAGVTAATP